MNGFDAIIAVDWSAANVPTLGKNSIWVCVQRPSGLRVENIATREDAVSYIDKQINETKGRVLIGFDVCFGYPKGLFQALGLNDWQCLWQLITNLVEDDALNQNNRFAVGAILNQMIDEVEGPFWGCPKAKETGHLSMKKPKNSSFSSLRTTESNVSGAQSAWKLAYPGSVGGQTLTCIARLWPLVQKLKSQRSVKVWPFEQLSNASDEVVFAEVYHSMYNFDTTDVIKDRAQVIGCCQALANAPLRDWFQVPKLHPESQEEGWTLGVTY